MSERAAFARLVRVLSPWAHQFVFVGGWAHRLYRLHPLADAPPYQPLATLDVDVAFAEHAPLEGDIRGQLLAAGFQEELTGNHHPPVSQYILGEDAPSGFYAEFLTPMTGSGRTRAGEPLATVQNAGITAQRLRYLELLLVHPWDVVLDADWGADPPPSLRIPNPVAFIVQKLLIHDQRLPGKKAQDILYIHDTLELFGPELDRLSSIWRNELRGAMHANWARDLMRAKAFVFGEMNDRVRDAAAMVPERELNAERMRAMCIAALDEILGPGLQPDDRS
jgi:hypothetical protein